MTLMTDRTRHDARRDALAGRLFGAVLGALDLQAVYLGDRLGLYRALADGGPATAPSWPSAPASTRATPGSGSSTRPSAASSTSTTSTAAPDDRRYTLPAGHEEVLARPGEPRAVWRRSPASSSGRPRRMPALLEAYRTGGGVDWADYGRTSSRPRRPSTGRSSPTSSATGSTRCRTSPRGCATARVASPTSPVAPAGRRSPSPGTSRQSRSTASTSTRGRSSARRRTPPPRG